MADATLATAPLFDVSLSIGPPEVLPEMMEARIIFEPFYDAAGSSPDCAELLLTEIETKFAVDAYSDAVSTASHSLKGAAGTAGATAALSIATISACLPALAVANTSAPTACAYCTAAKPTPPAAD